MTTKLDWYPMEYELWDEGTDPLTLELEGAYLRICHQIYRRRGPFPSHPNTLARVLRVHQNKAVALLKKLVDLGKVSITSEGCVTQEKATRTLQERDTKRTLKVDAGRAGGIQSGIVRAKSLENNDVDEASASKQNEPNEPEERRGEESRGEERVGDALRAPAPSSDADGEAPPMTSTATPSKKPKKIPKPKLIKSRIDPDWRMGTEQLDYARRYRLTEVEAAKEWKNFKGHHHAKGTEFVVWDAAWQNWVRRSAEYLKKGPPLDAPVEAAPPPAQRSADDWKKILKLYGQTNNWPLQSPPPGEPGCLVPPELINHQPDLI